MERKSAMNEPTVKPHAENPYMQLAIEEALEGISKGHGGPFGSVVVKDGRPVGRGHNRVLCDVDSTAHGEIAAIRDAERRLNTHDLSGCVLYTTGEPCPMCLFACLWANLDRVYYGCTIADNGLLGFRDKRFDELTGGREKLDGYLIRIDRKACLELFGIYRDHTHETY
jgi:tRNA(Arg) A34 adenosine deaminase TadA